MNEIAKNLNDIINIYGFGCEFGIEDLVNNFEDADGVIDSLAEHDLVEKNQLSGKYYLSDIFTCNSFLAQYLKEDEKKAPKSIEKTYDLSIEKEDLIEFIKKLKGFEENIKNIEIKSNVDTFEINLKIDISKDSLSKLENRLINYLTN